MKIRIPTINVLVKPCIDTFNSPYSIPLITTWSHFITPSILTANISWNKCCYKAGSDEFTRMASSPKHACLPLPLTTQTLSNMPYVFPPNLDICSEAPYDYMAVLDDLTLLKQFLTTTTSRKLRHSTLSQHLVYFRMWTCSESAFVHSWEQYRSVLILAPFTVNLLIYICQCQWWHFADTWYSWIHHTPPACSQHQLFVI